jgi:hypothetical protein
VSEANLAVGWAPDGFAGRAGRARALPVDENHAVAAASWSTGTTCFCFFSFSTRL